VYLFSDTGSYVNGQTLVGESPDLSTAVQITNALSTVDGAAWRMSAGGASNGELSYPDFLLSGQPVPNVKTGKNSKL
jgi:peroxisomal 2,4-dienoyl-CoA reductase